MKHIEKEVDLYSYAKLKNHLKKVFVNELIKFMFNLYIKPYKHCLIPF